MLEEQVLPGSVWQQREETTRRRKHELTISDAGGSCGGSWTFEGVIKS